jgi:1-acyl-sn-glycerol-3-phosphate acyltransferase
MPASAAPSPETRRLPGVRTATDLIFRGLVRRHVVGLENIPESGAACILVFNHLSNFDPHLLFTLVRRADATGLVAADYRPRRWSRIAIEAGGGMWINRGGGSREALRDALALLDRGWLVGLAPEGRRSPTGSLREGKPGAAFLASRAGVPVIPVGVTGTERIHRELSRLRRTPVTIRIGEPFFVGPSTRIPRKEAFREATELIMTRIAAELPPPYRGAYAGNPLLREIEQHQPTSIA